MSVRVRARAWASPCVSLFVGASNLSLSVCVCACVRRILDAKWSTLIYSQISEMYGLRLVVATC